MAILLKEDYQWELPKMVKVIQHFDAEEIVDLDTTIRNELAKVKISQKIKKGNKVAIAVGSRGIRNINRIIEILIEEVKNLGASPYIVSAMGSHGNGTEEGQREVLKSYGITEENLGVPVITTVNVQYLGSTKKGTKIYFDQAAIEADAIIPVNRIKLHTDFVGALQSGLCKMLVIGLGNQIGCSSIHEEDPKDFSDIIEEAARIILDKCPVIFGLGILENAYDKTFAIKAVPREYFVEREKELLKIAKEKMPMLMVSDIDILIVEEIGKNISGAGYDPNILGRSSVLKEFSLPVPKIKQMIVLDISPESHGNGIGLGLFDVTTEKVYKKLDREAMYTNAIACRCIEDVKIPIVAKNEDEAIRVAAKCIRGVSQENLKIVKIKNTLDLGEIWVSQAVLKELHNKPAVECSGLQK